MVCRHCGNQLSIEDEKCPYCGQINEAALKHAQEMKHFSGQFQEVKQDVMEQTSRIKSLVPLLVLIAVLAVSNVLVVIGLEQVWRVESSLREWQLNRRESTYYNKLSEMEMAGEFFALGTLYAEENMYQNERLREFTAVADAGKLYGSVQENLGMLAQYQVGRATEEECDMALQSLGNQIKRLYEIFDGSAYRYTEHAMDEGHLAALEEIRSLTEQHLAAICDCSAEELTSLAELESQGIASLLRRKVVEEHE